MANEHEKAVGRDVALWTVGKLTYQASEESVGARSINRTVAIYRMSEDQSSCGPWGEVMYDYDPVRVLRRYKRWPAGGRVRALVDNVPIEELPLMITDPTFGAAAKARLESARGK